MFDPAKFPLDTSVERLRRQILPLVMTDVAGETYEHEFSGTCFMIGTNVALTANHVARDWERLNEEHQRNYEFEPRVLIGDPAKGQMIRCKTVFGYPEIIEYDGAILIVNDPPELLPLDFGAREELVPAVGDEVLAIGARYDVHNRETSPTPNVNPDVRFDFPKITGTVTGIYRDMGADDRRARPCFTVDFEIPHGMSGGPVFNINGRVIGICSAGFDFGGNDQPADGSVALLDQAIDELRRIPRGTARHTHSSTPRRRYSSPS